MTGFQKQVNYQPAPGVLGDFATTNPRASVISGPGSIVAGAAGVSAGQFVWLSYIYVDADEAPAVANNFGSGAPAGFVGREQQGLIQNYLQEFSMVIPGGFPVTPYDQGDFWMLNSGTTYAQVGQKVYANFANGQTTAAAAGSPTNATGSASSIAASTSSFTGSITDNTLTVTGTVTGTIYPGTTISGTNVTAGTQILGQVTPLLSGEATGGDGRYYVSIGEQTVAATTISGTYGTLTVGGTVAGTWGVGQTLSGTNVVAGTAITALISGTGGSGTYVVNNNTVVSSTAITAATNYETKWSVRSGAAPGEIFKATSWQ